MVEFLSGFFIHPTFWAIAAGVISVPIIIHLINRLRFKRIRWAAMEFLLKAQKKNRRRLIIEQLLLLALRCLLVALLGVLVMRFVGINFADLGVKQSIHIVLLDDSLSMQDRWKKGDGYTNCFEVARDEMLINKLGDHLSKSKTADKIMVLPLSQAVGEIVFTQDEALTKEDAFDATFGKDEGRVKIVPITRALEKGVRYGVQVTCEGFKGHVRLIGPNQEKLAHDDDSGGLSVASVEHEVAASGEYKVEVASHDDKLGKFQIEVTSAGAPRVFVPSTEFNKFKEEMAKLEPTKLHLNLLAGVRRARKLADQNSGAMITLHVFSDFRKRDWGEEASALHKELLEFAKQHKAQVRLVDTMLDPARSGATGSPPGHDNIGIVDLRPRSRMVGKNMPATFTLSIANYGPERVNDVYVDVFELRTGREYLEDINFVPKLPLTLPSRRITQVTFELRFSPDITDNESSFEGIAAHLKATNLDKEGLLLDNVGYGVVEVRNQVPVLIVDGEGKAGYDDVAKGRDSFFLERAFLSVPGASSDESGAESPRPFRVDFPYNMGYKNPMAVLESADLRKYPAIILCNVPKLTAGQLENLQKYVKGGGGLGIFLGPLVDTDFYNKDFYDNGKGLFPAKLAKTYFPPEGKPALNPRYIPEVPMILVRDEDPKIKPFPIFGPILVYPKQRELLEDLPIKRYFPIESRTWLDETAGADKADDKGLPRVLELATLANDKPTDDNYQKQVMEIIGDPAVNKPGELGKLLQQEKFAQYRGTAPDVNSRGNGFARYRRTLKELVEFSQKPFFLARELERMLKDRGETKASPNLEEFWSNPDPDVQKLKTEVAELLKKVRYDDGAPYVLASSYGHGKVVAVMGTAGEAWSKWPARIDATALYQPFIWEMQNYLSVQGADVNLTLGQRLDVNVNAASFPPHRSVEMFRYFVKEIKGNEAVWVPDEGQVVTAAKDRPLDKKLTFGYPGTREPGVYVTRLYDQEEKKAADAAEQAAKDKGGEAGKAAVEPPNNDPKKVTEKDVKKPKELLGKDDKKAASKKAKALWAAASVFNVDTIKEGNLDRITYDFIKENILDKADKRIMFTGTELTATEMVPDRKDLSEMPLLFLLFLAILVAEQALAVHLSFHLKGNEGATPAGQPSRAPA